jgi:uncharacterized protein
MRLYSGLSRQFIQDTSLNQIAGKLQNAFFNYFQYSPSPAEVSSWKNSLRSLSLVFSQAGLDDHGVILEYQLPLTSQRIDCLVCGKDHDKQDNAVLIELKQWEKCESCPQENEVLTFIGGRQREILHPSVQVGHYKLYLEDTNTAFYDTDHPVNLSACSYLHNYYYNPDDAIFDAKFDGILSLYPTFTADDVEKLGDYIIARMDSGQGSDVLKRIEQSPYRPSKKLMDHVAQMIRNRNEYILLDEQQVVYDKVLSLAQYGFHDRQKAVVVVKGGPGTGKSVIAINLMAELLEKQFNSQYATGSRAFTGTLRNKIGPRGSAQFKYFNSYSDADANSIDVLICDEAHRLRETSDNRFTPKNQRTDIPQVHELLNAAKCTVFFIDDNQIVRPNEIGSVDYIVAEATKGKCKIFEYELEAQFRCAGSDAFVNWINNTLSIKRTANVLWDTREEFDFRIFENPLELEASILEKSSLGNSARLAAGFCWKWSEPDSDGNLFNDVNIGSFSRPWNAKPEASRLAPGIPKDQLWASDPNGINQIGCIYTAQGFEFDYIGVIFGKDLVYDLDGHRWKGQKEFSADSSLRTAKNDFVEFVKNRYRVLLSRGLKGCYVYFQDKDTERFVRSRIEYH